MKIEIDVAEFAAQLKAGKGIGGKDGALTPLIKQLTEMALQAELETHLSQDLERNRKNDTSSKTMKSANGTFDLETPRDRNGSFEPELVKKNQTHMNDELETKMLSLFALGNSYAQIADHIEDIYGVHFSKPAITAITDKLIPKLEEWKKRPLDAIYPFIYLDAIHYKVRDEGHL
jgi:putative transposase